jgi:CheY-like chemotaxis protein
MSQTMTSYSILIADHEIASSDFVRSTLVADGYNTNIAISSHDAISSAPITQPQLLLINPGMIHPSGIEAAKQIHLDTDCKVLFLSPLADDPHFRDVLAGLQKQGCQSSALRVPCTREELLARVRIAVGSPHSPPGQSHYPAETGAPGTVVADNHGLLAMMRPQLYTLNAFRIMGLDVAASIRDLACPPEGLETSANTAADAQSRDVFKLGDPSPAQMQVAMQSLQSPEQRLMQAFFWFWPISFDRETDDGLLALHRGEFRLAETFWTAYGVGQRELESVHLLLNVRCSEAEQALLLEKKRSLNRAKAISIHNLAVLHHLYALRLEMAPQADRVGQHAERLSEWKKAFAFWSLLRNQHGFPELFPERFQALYETWLAVAGQRIWKSMPLALLTVNAELAARAIEEQNFDAALEQRQIMKGSAFGQHCVTQALHGSLKPITEELARLCENAEASSRANPSTGYPTVRGLFAEANKYLRGLRCLLDTGDSVRAAAHDRVAQSARTCLWACANKTQDWHVAQPLFQECLHLAEGNSLRFSLRQDIETIADKIAARQDRTPSYFASTVRAQRDDRQRRRIRGSVVVLVAVAVALISLFVAFDRPSSSPDPAAAQTQPATDRSLPIASSTSAPSLSIPLPSPIEGGSERSAPASSVDLSALRRSITHNTIQLRGMEPSLTNLKERLAVLQYGIAADKASLDKREAGANVGKSDDKTNESTRAHRNASLAAYNSLTSDYIAMLQRYESLAQATNAQIASYNSQVGSQADRLPGYRTKW